MKRPNPQFLQSIAPSKRSAITEDQAALFSMLIFQYQNDLLNKFSLEDIRDLDLNRHQEAQEALGYQLLLLAGYACGFICCDLDANFYLESVCQDPMRVIGDCDLHTLRHYVHTLFRSERISDGHGSSILDAYQCGALALVASRLKHDERLRDY